MKIKCYAKIPKNPFKGIREFFAGDGQDKVFDMLEEPAKDFAEIIKKRIEFLNLLNRKSLLPFKKPESLVPKEGSDVSELYANNIVVESDKVQLTHTVKINNMEVDGYTRDLEALAKSREEGVMDTLKPVPVWREQGRKEENEAKVKAKKMCKKLRKPLKKAYLEGSRRAGIDIKKSW